MQNIILLFARFGTLIAFVVLEIVCFVLIVNYNQEQRSIFINSSNVYANKIDQRASKWSSYLSLQEVNDSLARHNASLMEIFINSKIDAEVIRDTAMQYELMPSHVLRNTYHLRNNHITLDRGSKDGVKKDMGVISESGIVGIVRNVSENLSHVISVLNSQTRISCTVKPYNYPGNLVWKNMNPKYMTLESIPKHVNISVGDTVVTNGYSTIFPADIAVGTITSYKINKGSSNFDIKVKLFNDIPNTKMVYIIQNKLAEEQKELERLDDE